MIIPTNVVFQFRRNSMLCHNSNETAISVWKSINIILCWNASIRLLLRYLRMTMLEAALICIKEKVYSNQNSFDFGILWISAKVSLSNNPNESKNDNNDSNDGNSSPSCSTAVPYLSSLIDSFLYTFDIRQHYNCINSVPFFFLSNRNSFSFKSSIARHYFQCLGIRPNKKHNKKLVNKQET